MACKLEIREQ